VETPAEQSADTVPNRSVIFLLGAGASVEAGLPSSDEITRTLVEYGSHCPDPESTVIENLLRYVQVRIADYLEVRASDVNFEYVLGVLVELCSRQQYAVAPLLGVGDDLVQRLERRIPLSDVVDRLYEVLRELLTLRRSVTYLNPIVDFSRLGRPFDVFTLNYDLALETALDDVGIPYTVGFKDRGGAQLAVWAPDEFERSEYAVRLFKLHGSLDWGQYFVYSPPRPNDQATGDVIRHAERYLAHYPELVRFSPWASGRVLPPDRQNSMVSVMNFGTRKEVLYASRQYTTLFGHFLASLARASICVVAGYSFRDERVNRLVEEAVVARNGSLRLVVVNRSVFELVQRSPILWKLRDAGLLSEIEEPFGRALGGGALMRRVEELLNTAAGPVHFSRISAHDRAPDATNPPDPQAILAAWKELRLTMSLLAFCHGTVAPRIRELSEVTSEEEAKELGQALRPILQRMRDLCYRVWAVYDAMSFGGVYREEHLQSATTVPRYLGQSDLDLARESIERMRQSLSYLYYHCWGVSAEFEEAVQNPEYGRSLTDRQGEGPTNLQVAEIVIRKTKDGIYHMASLLNRIYKGLGYSEPFATLAHHWDNDAADPRPRSAVSRSVEGPEQSTQSDSQSVEGGPRDAKGEQHVGLDGVSLDPPTERGDSPGQVGDRLRAGAHRQSDSDAVKPHRSPKKKGRPARRSTRRGERRTPRRPRGGRAG
jgi:hypothetical protein